MAAKHEEERAFVSRPGSPIMEEEREGLEMENEYKESGCGCFRLFSLGWGHRRATNGAVDDDVDLLDRERERGAEHRESWVGDTLKSVKEASELVAGPKWKNFIRKLGKYFRDNKKKKNRSPGQFNYSPCSYALNFDNGVDEDDQEEGFLPGYSSRFAPPVSADHHQQQRPGL